MPSSESSNFLLQQYLRALAAASQARDIERALAIGEEATRRGVEHPNLLGLAAQKLMRAGHAEVAYPLLARARELSPRNADVLNDLGLCLVRLGKAREAMPLLDTALRQKPGSTATHFNKALAHEQLGQLDQERRQLERVVDIEPRHYQALSLLAMLAVDRGDDTAVRDYAGRALALSPEEIPAKIALASVEVAGRNFASARNILEPLLRRPNLDPDNCAIIQTLMGDLLDGEAKYQEAFRFYSASAETQKAHYARAFGSGTGETLSAQAARLTRYFRALPADAWCANKDAAVRTRPTHVFVLGFVRSGTTLLGQVLAGHPDIEVMHERPCLEDAVRHFAASDLGLDRLSLAAHDDLEPYRRSYWQKAREWGYGAARKVFVDKSPLATVHLPLIAKLFPDAKIVFSYRDPRDIVLSCFRRRFAMSEQKYEMLSLDGIAACYAAVMALADIYSEKLDLDVFDARHETLLSGFEGEIERLCDYLRVTFDAEMMDFASRTRASNMDIPDSAQLTRGLSRESEGHWRHYRNELTPVMPLLAPWCSRFGYSEN